MHIHLGWSSPVTNSTTKKACALFSGRNVEYMRSEICNSTENNLSNRFIEFAECFKYTHKKNDWTEKIKVRGGRWERTCAWVLLDHLLENFVLAAMHINRNAPKFLSRTDRISNNMNATRKHTFLKLCAFLEMLSF